MAGAGDRPDERPGVAALGKYRRRRDPGEQARSRIDNGGVVAALFPDGFAQGKCR
jgi:hypothetical protein